MSFSCEIKKELYSLALQSPQAISAELCGIFSFGGFTHSDICTLSFENKHTADRAWMLLDESSYRSDLSAKYHTTQKSNSKSIYTIELDANHKLFKNNLSISHIKSFANSSELCKNFLRGVFISCGSMSNPENEYHLEFDINNLDLCNALNHIFKTCLALNYYPGVTRRRNRFVAYLKESEKITDFLVFIGAQNSAMKLMQIKMIKEVRNNINRSTNFETANLSKITTSSLMQINSIKKIQNLAGLDSLPNYLQEIAVLRLANPYISLQELTTLYNGTISKSGINHRLKKIIKISENL